MSKLLLKIAKFLEKDLEKDKKDRDLKVSEIEDRQTIIDYFKNSDGVCVGLSVLWVYGKKIDDNLEKDQTKPRDDIKFFNNTQNTLLEWNEESEFDDQQTKDIERFISNILFYQRADLELLKNNKTKDVIIDNYDQTDIATTLENTENKELVASFSLKMATMPENMIASRLEKIVQPGNIILIGTRNDGAGHQMSIYRNTTDNKIYFYDPNSGEKTVDSIKELTNLFWLASQPSNFRKGFGGIKNADLFLRDFDIKSFRFSQDPEHKYPTLKETAITSEEFQDFCKDFPSLPSYILGNEQFQKFVDALELDQVIKILRQDSFSVDTKRALLARAIIRFNKPPAFTYNKPTLEDGSPALARYILNNHKNLVTDLQTEGIITPDHLANLSKVGNKKTRLEKPVHITYSNSTLSTPDYKPRNDLPHTPSKKTTISVDETYIKQFLDLYDQGLIDDRDTDNINIAHALCVIKLRPTDEKLAKNMLKNCYSDQFTEKSAVAEVLSPIISNNIKNGKIENAKFILEKLGKDFGIFPSIESIKGFQNEEVAQFILDNFHNNNFAHNSHWRDHGRERDILDQLPVIIGEMRLNNSQAANAEQQKIPADKTPARSNVAPPPNPSPHRKTFRKQIAGSLKNLTQKISSKLGM